MQFIVTYIQEATQTVTAPTLEAAGAFAKNYVANHKNLQLLSVYPDSPSIPLYPKDAA